MERLRVATRKSQLALAQTGQVVSLLTNQGYDVELVTFETKGDKVLDRALHEVGGKGLFTEELEAALLNGAVDIAVHSLKDLPTVLPEGLRIGAYALPEDRRDVIIGQALDSLPPGAVLGTSSLRRRAFIQHARTDVILTSVRGNLNTRLRKWEEGDYDALVLAAAGVIRLGWENLIAEYLDPHRFPPAPGQGILAVEVAASRDSLQEVLNFLNDPRAEMLARCERAVLDALGGGCQVPLGAYAEWVTESRIGLIAQASSLAGDRMLRHHVEFDYVEADRRGREVGERLAHEGAARLISRTEGT